MFSCGSSPEIIDSPQKEEHDKQPEVDLVPDFVLDPAADSRDGIPSSPSLSARETPSSSSSQRYPVLISKKARSLSSTIS